jgi:hypothetical protein
MAALPLFAALPMNEGTLDFSLLSDERLLERWRHYAHVDTRSWRAEDRERHWFEEECMWLEVLRRGLS